MLILSPGGKRWFNSFFPSVSETRFVFIPHSWKKCRFLRGVLWTQIPARFTHFFNRRGQNCYKSITLSALTLTANLYSKRDREHISQHIAFHSSQKTTKNWVEESPVRISLQDESKPPWSQSLNPLKYSLRVKYREGHVNLSFLTTGKLDYGDIMDICLDKYDLGVYIGNLEVVLCFIIDQIIISRRYTSGQIVICFCLSSKPWNCYSFSQGKS